MSTTRSTTAALPAMRYRRFGKTELQLPVFSCGGMRYQHKWQDVSPEEIPPDNQANLEACIRRSVALGIHHLETARGYGTSEMQLGPVLAQFPREQLIVQTKVVPSADPGEFRRTFDKSLAYLRLDYVDLLSLHGINNAELLEWSLRSGGCLDEARKLQREGRCRHVGFSTHATTDVILRAIESDAFDYVNLHWYFVNDLTWPAVEAATARDLGVFVISPNDKGGKLYAPPPKLTGLCAPLTPMQFNALYCLARPQIHTLSCGVARPSDFDEHVAALAHYDRAAEVVAPIEQRLRAELARVHGADWCARWFAGVPESCAKSCACGPMRKRSISSTGDACGTTCSARPTTGSPAPWPGISIPRPCGRRWLAAPSPTGSSASFATRTNSSSKRRSSDSARVEAAAGGLTHVNGTAARRCHGSATR